MSASSCSLSELVFCARCLCLLPGGLTRTDTRPPPQWAAATAMGGRHRSGRPADRPVAGPAGVSTGVRMGTELIDRARSGDATAFEQLVAPYRHEMQVH